MATSLRAFNTGLYEEHLEEISFLYEQRGALLKKPDLSWRAMAPFEARLEAHLDALVVGRGPALEVCRRLAAEGDFGQLFGAVSIYCRQEQVSLLAGVVKSLDYTNLKKAGAVADALKFEMPEDWTSFIVQSLARKDARLTPILASVSGYRRLRETAAVLADALAQAPAQPRRLIEALGSLGAGDARPALSRYLSHPDASLRTASLLSLLRCGSVNTMESTLHEVAQEPSSRIPLALAAGRSLKEALLVDLHAGRAAPDCLLGLGLLGDPTSLRDLYVSLDDPALAETAAQALQWVTGASMDKEIFVPEEVDESVLFKNELQVWKQYKQAPKRLDGQPFGEMAKGLCVDKDAWKRWFSANASSFEPALRYRNGKPVSPASLLSDLMADNSSTELRRYTALELEIRYGCDIAFEVDMPVTVQATAMRQIAGWVQARMGYFEPGRWYCYGSLQ